MRTVFILAVGFLCLNVMIAQKMTVKDDDSNVLMEVNDEGSIGSITLPSGSAPASTSNKLYNLSGTLNWNGNQLLTSASSINADMVDGIHASTTPAANKLLSLGADGKFPVSVVSFNVYDSGWFSVSKNSNYTKTHNLGTIKALFFLYFASNASGSSMQLVDATFQHEEETNSMGAVIDDITTSQCIIRTGSASVVCQSGTSHSFADKVSSGYYRLIVLSLE